MKYSLNKIIILCGIVLLNGCYLLDVDTVSDMTNDDYWKSKGDVESHLFGTYTKLRDVLNSTYVLEDRSDSFEPGLEGGPSTAWSQNLTAQNGRSWLDYYTVIQHCNNLIKNAEPIGFGMQEEKDRLLAETYFIRAYMYFIILRAWGDAPIELEPTESDKKPQLHRSPVSDVLEQVLSDVNTAISLFPEETYKNGKSRASKPACYALKADALLWRAKVLGGTQQDYLDVIELADKVSMGLSLEGNFADIYGTKKGKEVIFAIHFDVNEKSAQYSQALKPRDVFVEKAVNNALIPYAKSGARSTYKPSAKLIQSFSEQDKRKDQTYIIAIDANNNVIGTFDNKMRGTVAGADRSYDSDIVVYRLAEMIMFKAEAYAALGRTAEAVAEFNKIRDRAGTGSYTGAMDKASVEKEILDERLREFWLECKRWPDLLRFHFGSNINVYDQVPNLNNKRTLPLFFAIPLKDLDNNPNLEQTKGYLSVTE
jgi:hypothetical protein